MDCDRSVMLMSYKDYIYILLNRTFIFQTIIVNMSGREFLPSEVSRLVLSYLLENNYDRTREVFMSECPTVAELKSLSPHTLIHNCTVNGRNLSKILKDYMR